MRNKEPILKKKELQVAKANHIISSILEIKISYYKNLYSKL